MCVNKEYKSTFALGQKIPVISYKSGVFSCRIRFTVYTNEYESDSKL